MARRRRDPFGGNPDREYELVIEEYHRHVRATVSFEALLKRLGLTYHKTSHGNLMRCCIWHREKNPSLRFVTRQGFFYCHGCKWSGDAINFVERRLGGGMNSTYTFFRRHFGIPSPNNRKFYLEQLEKRS